MAISYNGTPYYHKNVTPSSVALWMRYTSVAGSLSVCGKGDNPNNTNGWVILINEFAAGGIRLYCQNASATVVSAVNNGLGLNNGNWHHVACNLDYTNGGLNSLYVDGALAASANASSAWGGTTYEMEFGRTAANNWSGFPGDMAEMACFSAQLSADQVLGLARGFSAKHILPSALQCWIPVIRHTPGSAEYDDKTGTPFAGAAVLSNTGSEAYAEHPRLYY